MGRQLKAAVVGTGVVGGWHVGMIPRIPDYSLVAVCDRDPEKARASLEKNKVQPVPVYADLDDMLRKEAIDIVHVCTPSGDHFTPVTTCLEAGKHVICEKPMEIELDRIDRMTEISRKTGCRLAGIFQNRWNDANRAIKAAAEEGRFGTIAWAGCFTPWYRPDKYYEEGGWRGTRKWDGGGAIMNQSVHAIDLLQWIVGPVKTVSAYASSRIHPKIEVEDTLSAAIEFENGGFGTIMGTTAMFPGLPARIEIGGENGTAVSENGLKFFQFREERPSDAEALAKFAVTVRNKSGGGASNTDIGLDLHARNIMHILQCWEEGRDAETAGAEARKAVAIVLAMYESARQGGAAVRVR
jgi:UDP-N-acetyl-2-amino-2-deoxyglucuronate dehydrogenase